MYGLRENAKLTAQAAASMAAASTSYGVRDRPAYYRIPTEFISHLQLEMPHLKVNEKEDGRRTKEISQTLPIYIIIILTTRSLSVSLSLYTYILTRIFLTYRH